MKPDMNIEMRASRLLSVSSFVLAGLITVFLVFLSSCGKEESTVAERKVVRPVKMMTLTSSGETTKFTFPGKVRASQRVDLAFQVSGPLIKLPIKEGQQVKKGDLLAQIDPGDD